MGIKTFSPERVGITEEQDLEKKMGNKDVISHADVKEYASYIIGHLRVLKNSNEEEKESFVVDAFRDGRIFKKNPPELKKPGELNEKEAQAAIKRVRQALLEELKGKIDSKIYLVVRNFIENDPDIDNSVGHKNYRRNIIGRVIDVESEKENIFKDQEPFFKNYKEDMVEAIALFRRLPAHSNIVNIKDYDPANQRAIFQKLNLQTVENYLVLGRKNKDDFIIGLKAIKDCLAGAVYLADNGLVLQDIKLDNLGLEIDGEEKKGVLFDLEGIIKEGTIMDHRIGVKEYTPPEFLSPPPEEVLRDKGIKVRPSEMVYQFGVCVQEVLDIYDNPRVFTISDRGAVAKLDSLVKKMTEKNPENRISLAEAKMELEKIISNFKV